MTMFLQCRIHPLRLLKETVKYFVLLPIKLKTREEKKDITLEDSSIKAFHFVIKFEREDENFLI